MGREQYDSAIAVLSEAIAAQPGFAESYRNRGRAYRSKGDPAGALREFDRAVALQPTNPAYYNDRGITYQLMGDYERAFREYSAALAQDRGFALARKNRGRLEFYMGRFAEAAEDLELGRQLDSTNAYVAIWLHFINRRLGRDDATQFAAQVAMTDSVHWPAPVAKYYLGRLGADSLVAVSANTDSKAMKDQRCAVAFFFGEELMWKRRFVEAREKFEQTRASCPRTSTEYEGAVAELGRLSAPRR